MGGAESRAEMIKRFNKIKPEKWDIIKKEGLTEIAVDPQGREGQVNIIKIDPTKKLEEELEVYYYRRTFDGPLVKAYGAQSVQSKSTGVCGADNVMKVITERIVKRWGELPQLTFPEVLYSLSQALQGYQALFKQVGIFEVNHNMLGLNNHGDLHVWLNQNFADNSPALQKGVLYTTGTEKLGGATTEGEMVKNVLSVIEDKCEEGRYPEKFGEQIYRESETFKDALEFVDDYIVKNKILTPNKIHLDNNKMYVSKTRKMQIISGSRLAQEQNALVSRTSPIRADIKNLDYSILNSASKQQKISKPFSNTVYQTTYVQNQVMTPKHVVFGLTKQNGFSNETPVVSGGYYTGSQGVSIPANQQYSKYTDLRYNPNIDVAESIYEAKQRTPQSHIRSNQASSIKPFGSGTALINESVNHQKGSENQKIQIIGNRTIFTSNSPSTTKEGLTTTLNGATSVPQYTSGIQTTANYATTTNPTSTYYTEVNRKTPIKFNYLGGDNQSLTQKIGITSLGATNQINPSSDENKIVMETSQVTKQY